MKRFLVVVTVWLVANALGAGHTWAQKADEALIRDLVDDAVKVLSDGSLQDRARERELRPLFSTYMDLPFIGRFVLGRNWRALSPDTQRNYIDAFEEYVVSIYAKRLDSYSGETMSVLGSQAVNEKDSLVTTQLVRRNGPPVGISWRVRQNGGDYKVIDVIVEGVSMVVSQREEFSAYLQRNSIDDLIKRLRAETDG